MTVFITLVLVVLTITSVANSSSDQDNSWHLMCEMHHKDMFVFDASVSSFGCKLSCTVLTSTSDKHKAFFDKSVTHEHNLNDGTYCKRDHICKEGNCTLEFSSDSPNSDPDKKGIVVIDVLNATLPKKDTMTSTDGYVKLSIMGPAGDNDVGQTKVHWDTKQPTFNHTFKVEEVSIASTIFFEIFDRDILDSDDYIATVYLTMKKILQRSQNGKAITLPFPDGSLRVAVTWLGNEIETR